MKAFVIFLGTIGAAIVLAVGTLLWFGFTKGRALDAESHRYAGATIQAIVSNWNEQALLDRGSIELTEAAHSQVDLAALFARWRQLGKMTTYEGSKGEANIRFTLETGEVITAVYVARADFEQGEAQIKIVLLKAAGKWQVAGFAVYPKPRILRPRVPAARA